MGRSNARPLTETHPSLAAQWHPTRNGWPPLERVTAGMGAAWWLCPGGHEWEEAVAARTAMPGWKRGDVAACRECRAADPVAAHDPAVGLAKVVRVFGCGHEKQVTIRNLWRYGLDECFDCWADRTGFYGPRA